MDDWAGLAASKLLDMGDFDEAQLGLAQEGVHCNEFTALARRRTKDDSNTPDRHRPSASIP